METMDAHNTWRAEKFMFLDLKPIEGGTIAFRGMGKRKITSIGKIGVLSLASIDNTLNV